MKLMLNIQKLLNVISKEERKQIKEKKDLIKLLTKHKEEIDKYSFSVVRDKHIIDILKDSIISINGNYILFHYGDKIQINYYYNELVKEMRGLILKIDTLEIMHYPFDKFFNYSEIENYKELLPFENKLLKEAEEKQFSFAAIEKMDGSMGLL